MSPRERQILELIQANPRISQQEIANSLGISRSAVAGHIMKLTASGRIRGRGYLLGGGDFVVCAGGANLDMHGRSTAPLLAAESNPGSIAVRPGGVARNVAENLARLGVDTRLIAAVGNDANGRFLLEHAREAGIDTGQVRRSSTAATSSYLAVLDANGELAVGVNDMQAAEELTADVLTAHRALLSNAALVVVDTNLPAGGLDRLLGDAEGRPVFADAVSAAKAPRLSGNLARIHTLKATVGEARALAGGQEVGDSADLAHWLNAQGVDRVVLSDGAGDILVSRNSSQRRLAVMPPASPVQSTSGAGDALTAGLVYAWLQDLDDDEAFAFALSAASLTVLDPYNVATSMSVEAVHNHLKEHNAQ